MPGMLLRPDLAAATGAQPTALRWLRMRRPRQETRLSHDQVFSVKPPPKRVHWEASRPGKRARLLSLLTLRQSLAAATPSQLTVYRWKVPHCTPRKVDLPAMLMILNFKLSGVSIARV